MLGASSKSGETGATGKFGLGFKSVLLASARPHVWSGDLSFEIVAGCLPQHWTPGMDTRVFQRRHHGAMMRPLRSTLIELPLDRHEEASEITRRFAGLAGVLTVFSQNIRQVTLDGHQHAWKPEVLHDRGGCTIEAGPVQLPTSNGMLVSRLLVLRARSGAVALRVDGSGVIVFEPSAVPVVPAIWVLAPTRGTAARGVLINAPFHIDTGRGSLALGKTAARNRDLVRSIADELSDVLIALYEHSESDWQACSAALGCSQQVSSASFWFGFWKVLFAQSPAQDAAEDVQLVESFAGRLFQRVVSRTGKIPTGISFTDSGFASLDQLNLSVKLDRLGALVPVLTDWPSFVVKYPGAGWCAEDVPDWLKRADLRDDVSAIARLEPAAVINSFPDGQLRPDQIPGLAAVLNSWPRGTLEDSAWKGLGGLTLLSVTGSWVIAQTLLIESDPEYSLVSRFAPPRALLDPCYSRQGAEWQQVRSNLPKFRLDNGLLSEWCLSASGRDAQVGVLHFLAHHPYHPVFPMLINRNRFMPGWMALLTGEHELFREFPTEDVRLLLAKLGLASEESPGDDEVAEAIPLDLVTIWHWWTANREALLPVYEAKLWPAHVDRTLLLAAPYDRQAWMTLFSLAVFRRYGRANDEQHRGFLDFLHSKGWWDIIWDVHPDLEPEVWMGILSAYAESQAVTTLFENWMDSFPRLYRVARWLRDYVHLFQSLDLRTDAELAALLTPHSDSSLRGSEIDAPTLRGILRLGWHLVVRELLRAGALQSARVERLAYMPRSSVLELLSGMGHAGLQTSQEIHQLLVDQLGAGNEQFHGDYDIPLQLLATSAALRAEAAAWTVGSEWDEDEEDDINGEGSE